MMNNDTRNNPLLRELLSSGRSLAEKNNREAPPTQPLAKTESEMPTQFVWFDSSEVFVIANYTEIQQNNTDLIT